MSSFAQQYGIRLTQVEDMPWSEFCSLLHGISPETSLGKMVQVRAEEDRELIKQFTRDQRAERNRWRTRQAEQMTEEDIEKQMQSLEKMIASAFG